MRVLRIGATRRDSMTSPRCIDLLFVTLAILAPIGSSGYAASEYPPEIASIAGEIAERIAKSKAKTKGGVNEPQLIVLASTYSKELLSALAIHSGRLKIGDQDCAVRTIQELKLPPKEYLHYAAAAWLARECEASLVVISIVNKWRLKPALDAQQKPVPAWTTIEVIFREYATAGRDNSIVPQCEYCPSPVADCTPKKAAGVVLLRLMITTDGKPENISIVKGIDSCLDQKALAEVRKWRFTPAHGRNGEPVPFWTTLEIRFRQY